MALQGSNGDAAGHIRQFCHQLEIDGFFPEPSPSDSHPTIKVMGKMRRFMPAMVALLLAFLCSSCIVRGGLRPLRRKRDQKTGKVLDLKTATRDELNARIKRIYDSI